MRLFWLLALSLAWVPGMAQQGDYFMVHYAPPFLDQNYQIFDMAQDEDGVMYFAHHNGILLFDGNNWSNKQAPGSVFALEIADNGIIYAGGAMGIHTFTRNTRNEWQFMPVTSGNLLQDIIDVETNEGGLYAISTNEVYHLDPESG